ncbi:helix-turn-helix transcriptional regulator [Glaesserella parasuis]|uniref:helix-turn-helix transcriptional regulator n=1 Tax=Glaesserella parasuis TaxID=738 RepID=UPI0024363F7D|nr:hypothetical protein [Glaesserella parasuis]MDG6306708.1 hypothetical protein [Glaesserella parasuis]MDG6342755.1 hypothetical protein [Glaesserella parasuis]
MMEQEIVQAVSNEQNLVTKNEPDIEFIRLGEAVRLFGVSRATFDRWQRKDSEYYIPDFPKKIKIGNFSFYVRPEIRAYMQKLIDEH